MNGEASRHRAPGGGRIGGRYRLEHRIADSGQGDDSRDSFDPGGGYRSIYDQSPGPGTVTYYRDGTPADRGSLKPAARR